MLPMSNKSRQAICGGQIIGARIRAESAPGGRPFARSKMTKPIPDKAEVALEYPDKLYVGTFERSSRFEAHLDPTGFALVLERLGDEDVRKSIHMHINFGLFASILKELATSVGSLPTDDILHRDELLQAVAELHSALIRT
jgi:hypothetical protein